MKWVSTTICSLSVCVSAFAEGPRPFTLEVTATTMTQIVLRWENEPPNTVSFELQRATDASFTQDLKTYALAREAFVFSDTDRPPVSKGRFRGDLRGPVLDQNTTYTYRLKAILPDGGHVLSNAVRARVHGPVRGVEGDLWADVVLGKPDFEQNVEGKPTKYACWFPGGVLIDKTVRPNRMYIADCNNNRILGYEHLGVVELGLGKNQNLARGKTYTTSTAPDGSHPDKDGREFTDGVASTTWENSFGYRFSSPGSVDIDVDLGRTEKINFAVISTGGGNPDYRAALVTIFASTAGDRWTQVAKKSNPQKKAEIRALFDEVQARYVRFRGTTGTSPGWLFLGEGMVGRVTKAQIAEQGTPCSTDSDCKGGNWCRLTPDRGADLVIGQPNFNSSAGNGDSCAQVFPYRGAAGASTLCLTLPTQISMGETIVAIGMALDEEGNLYVPDVFNNRVLKYERSFDTDAVADRVWGQDDFAGNKPNKGHPEPSNSSLNFHVSHRSAVTFDAAGNLWVADSGNHRVLRFPKDSRTGRIGDGADVVLGQKLFTTRMDAGRQRTLAQLTYPRGLAFGPKGRLYVSDGITNVYDGRVLVFDPPFSSGMSARKKTRPPEDLELNNNPAFAPAIVVSSLVNDVKPGRMWMQKNSFTAELVDLQSGKSITSVMYAQNSGVDVDCDGNLFVVAKWYGIYRYPASSWSLPWPARAKLVELVVPGRNAITPDTTGGILGITTLKDQLIISDRSRMLIWNDFELNKLKNGHPADDVFGEEGFSTIGFRSYFWSPQVDRSGRLWVCRRIHRGHHVLEAYKHPLRRDSTAIQRIEIADNEKKVLPVRGGGATRVATSDFIDFAVVGSGDKIWLADQNMSRVLRVNNVDGQQEPGKGPYVDIVLGQDDIASGKFNQGMDQPGAQTLDRSYNVGISPDGGLWITDNGGEVGTNRRILYYRRDRFPDRPEKVLFARDVGNPDKVIGTGGRLDVRGLQSDDPMCCPFELGIHPRGPIVATMNGYSDQRFPLVYLDPLKNPQPQIALGDFTSYPVVCFIDAEGNVYVGDLDWYRVLIYRKPFARILDSCN